MVRDAIGIVELDGSQPVDRIEVALLTIAVVIVEGFGRSSECRTRTELIVHVPACWEGCDAAVGNAARRIRQALTNAELTCETEQEDSENVGC
jgi:hypothetical protein